MKQKVQKIFFDFELIAFELVALNTPFYWERILFIGCQYVKKQSQDFIYYWNTDFGGHFFSEWSKTVTTILPCTFMQSFRPFNMLTVHKCSNTRLFRHLSNPAFCTLWFKKQITYAAHFFFKVFQILCRFRKLPKKLRKCFFIWI